MERILCAAIWYNDGKKHVHQPINIETGFVICGRRHHNCIGIADIFGLKPPERTFKDFSQVKTILLIGKKPYLLPEVLTR